MDTQQNIGGHEEADSDASALRKSLRPALIVSKRNLTEHSTFLRHLLVGLADESIPVALVCPPGFDLESFAPAPAAMFTHPLIDFPPMEYLGIERLADQVERFRPTVLHCLCESRAGLTRRLARRLDLPYLVMVSSLARQVHRLSISPARCARIIVPAESIRSHVAEALPQFADRITQISIGSFVDTDMMCFSNPSRLPSIVVAHPLRRVSDFADFLQAVKSLRTDSREFMVVIMGTGPAEHALRKHIAALGLSDIITIVPILNPWRSVVAAGDIFVQPQPLTAFSAFLLEAMAVGTAVAACWGGLDDLIIPNQTALTFEPGSEPSIRQALSRLLDDRDCARRLAATAQEHIRARYSVSAMISATLRTYREARQIRMPACS
ncbi:MAG TPA: glycosyltransferase family 4 protein [Sedimentisphaerales bacterium]|nr:glycosyltransferase family 4 protein [Sedimentisphaerales bacterium]HNU28310.1 glycosyltransferase family 4 protein [Sedimentisphaerales bacterium]